MYKKTTLSLFLSLIFLFGVGNTFADAEWRLCVQNNIGPVFQAPNLSATVFVKIGPDDPYPSNYGTVNVVAGQQECITRSSAQIEALKAKKLQAKNLANYDFYAAFHVTSSTYTPVDCQKDVQNIFSATAVITVNNNQLVCSFK